MTEKMARKSNVPTTRLGRFARLGLAAGELALGGVAQSVKSIASGKRPTATDVFLTAGNARKLAKRLAGMRGAAMKLGQIISMESSEFLPPEFAEALSVLRKTANTMPDAQLRGVLGREYGKGWEEQFREFDYEPIAAASIGQVHKAVTRSGEVVALKIQYPGVSKSINSDVDNMAGLIRLSGMLPAGIDMTDTLTEIKRQLRQEADYVQEAKNLKNYARLLKGNRKFVIPHVHDKLSTRRILAMDFIEGVPLESLGEQGVSQKVRDDVGRSLQELTFMELFEYRTVQSDPNFANYLYQPEEDRIVLLDFGSVVKFDSEFSENFAGVVAALIARDPDAFRRFAEGMGYLAPDSSTDYEGFLRDMIGMVCDPIRIQGDYDFSKSDLFARAREVKFETIWGLKDDYVIPSPKTTFLHRKLVGTFMILSRIRARINVHELIQPHLPVL